MTGIPDELVEKALEASLEVSFERYTNADEPDAAAQMRAALEAIGLPALLERVEAAEREVEKRDEVLAAVAADARQWQRQWNADHMKPETFDQGVGAHAQDVLALLADLGTDGV